jgi:hypothetical protein
MMLTGSRQRLCCGAWLLAAVLIGGSNLFSLMSLEARPHTGYSRTILEMQTNLQRFDAIIGAHGLPFHQHRELQAFFKPSPAAGNDPADPPDTRVGTESLNQVSKPSPLPALSGIIQTLDPNGSASFQAVLNGRGYREKDSLDDFTVDRITPSGVILRHSQQTWFIPCPTPFYSREQGE